MNAHPSPKLSMVINVIYGHMGMKGHSIPVRRRMVSWPDYAITFFGGGQLIGMEEKTGTFLRYFVTLP